MSQKQAQALAARLTQDLLLLSRAYREFDPDLGEEEGSSWPDDPTPELAEADEDGDTLDLAAGGAARWEPADEPYLYALVPSQGADFYLEVSAGRIALKPAADPDPGGPPLATARDFAEDARQAIEELLRRNGARLEELMATGAGRLRLGVLETAEVVKNLEKKWAWLGRENIRKLLSTFVNSRLVVLPNGEVRGLAWFFRERSSRWPGLDGALLAEARRVVNQSGPNVNLNGVAAAVLQSGAPEIRGWVAGLRGKNTQNSVLKRLERTLRCYWEREVSGRDPAADDPFDRWVRGWASAGNPARGGRRP